MPKKTQLSVDIVGVCCLGEKPTQLLNASTPDVPPFQTFCVLVTNSQHAGYDVCVIPCNRPCLPQFDLTARYCPHEKMCIDRQRGATGKLACGVIRVNDARKCVVDERRAETSAV